METTEIRVGEFVFDAFVDGPADGDLVLLLHGFPESSAEWLGVMPDLAALPSPARASRSYPPDTGSILRSFLSGAADDAGASHHIEPILGRKPLPSRRHGPLVRRR